MGIVGRLRPGPRGGPSPLARALRRWTSSGFGRARGQSPPAGREGCREMPTSEPGSLLTRVRPMGGAEVDLLIRAGRIASVGRGLDAAGLSRENGAGAIALPGLVDAHTHLDKSFLGQPWQSHSGGPRIADTIANERRLKQELGLDACVQSARQVVQSVAAGTTHIRSHVDVDPQVGVSSVEGVLATRERFAGIVNVEIVAFPPMGPAVPARHGRAHGGGAAGRGRRGGRARSVGDRPRPERTPRYGVRARPAVRAAGRHPPPRAHTSARSPSARCAGAPARSGCRVG
jgi:cytosine/adenosine deaminase-related metal-dependent hydrolase